MLNNVFKYIMASSPSPASLLPLPPPPPPNASSLFHMTNQSLTPLFCTFRVSATSHPTLVNYIFFSSTHVCYKVCHRIHNTEKLQEHNLKEVHQRGGGGASHLQMHYHIGFRCILQTLQHNFHPLLSATREGGHV